MIVLTFEIKAPQTIEESILNSALLYINDIKQFQQFKNTQDFESFKETNNRLVDNLMLSVKQLYI